PLNDVGIFEPDVLASQVFAATDQGLFTAQLQADGGLTALDGGTREPRFARIPLDRYACQAPAGSPVMRLRFLPESVAVSIWVVERDSTFNTPRWTLRGMRLGSAAPDGGGDCPSIPVRGAGSIEPEQVLECVVCDESVEVVDTLVRRAPDG